MVRSLNDYDIIFCDIDDTLIHGIWTDIMKYTWNIFRCNLLSDILMTLQNKFNIFVVNQKLRYMLINSNKPLVFLTARKHVEGTEKMLDKILGDREYYIEHLATDNPAMDKASAIFEYMENCTFDKACIFDDNDDVRSYCTLWLGIDAFDPRPMFERLIK